MKCLRRPATSGAPTRSLLVLLCGLAHFRELRVNALFGNLLKQRRDLPEDFFKEEISVSRRGKRTAVGKEAVGNIAAEQIVELLPHGGGEAIQRFELLIVRQFLVERKAVEEINDLLVAQQDIGIHRIKVEFSDLLSVLVLDIDLHCAGINGKLHGFCHSCVLLLSFCRGESLGCRIKRTLHAVAGVVDRERDLITGRVAAVGRRHDVAILAVCHICAGCFRLPEMRLHSGGLAGVAGGAVVNNLLKLLKERIALFCIVGIRISGHLISLVLEGGFAENVLAGFGVGVQLDVVFLQILAQPDIGRSIRAAAVAAEASVNVVRHKLSFDHFLTSVFKFFDKLRRELHGIAGGSFLVCADESAILRLNGFFSRIVSKDGSGAPDGLLLHPILECKQPLRICLRADVVSRRFGKKKVQREAVLVGNDDIPENVLCSADLCQASRHQATVVRLCVGVVNAQAVKGATTGISGNPVADFFKRRHGHSPLAARIISFATDSQISVLSLSMSALSQ
nr:MAG TPA: hypothetical protein [Caudoviricetes sp.]